MNIPYYDELVKARRFLESYYADFPIKKCKDSTRFLHHILGLEEISGRYIHGSTKQCHSWSYDPKLDIYIDLTLSQFDSTYDSISILPTSTPFLVKDKDEMDIHLIVMENFDRDELPLMMEKYEQFV